MAQERATKESEEESSKDGSSPTALLSNAGPIVEGPANSTESGHNQVLISDGSVEQRAATSSENESASLSQSGDQDMKVEQTLEKSFKPFAMGSEISATSVNCEGSFHPTSTSVQNRENCATPLSADLSSLLPMVGGRMASEECFSLSSAHERLTLQETKPVHSTSMENTEINSMPNEILDKIFSYLTLRELCDSVLPVCKRWNKIGNCSNRWNSVDFMYVRKSKERFLRGKKFLDHHCRRLLVKSIICHAVTYNFMKKTVAKCPNLESLTVISFRQAPPGILKMLAMSCLFLKSIIILSFPDVIDDPYAFVLNEVFLNKNLSELAILNRLSYPNIIGLIQSRYFLQTLSVDIGSHSLAGSLLIHNLQSSLKVLQLTCEYLTPDLKNALHSCSKLEKLEIVTFGATMDMSMNHLCDHQTSLRVMSLKSVRDPRFDAVPSMFHRVKFPNVTILYISFTGHVYSSGYRSLAEEIVTAFPRLQILRIMDASDYFVLLQALLYKRLRSLRLITLNLTRKRRNFAQFVVECCRKAGLAIVLNFHD